MRELDDSIEVMRTIPDEVSVYSVLPEDMTEGTAFHYSLLFPNLEEEMYYLLEMSHRQNADPDAVIALCREIVLERNKEVLAKFESKEQSEEIDINEFYQGTNISLQPVCDEETKRYDELLDAVLPETAHHTTPTNEHDG